ncbi:MAG TPA: hypothetical protein PKD09_11035 [Aggregatilinea sp.]|uniref:hypothetical protein n=1 Tax=Aggregatilinea sp. TaxID=2806333 RepID=UPI002CB5A453|nr:hypothetical protein [Aggregatilinea sp.]HML22176.1 hypothetical protein [Aggregatilinea sp.]
MTVSQTPLQQWLHDNCALCKHLGDRKWLDVRCSFASFVVWGGPPYSERDAATIRARINSVDCPDYIGDHIKQKRRRMLERLEETAETTA